MTQTPFVNDDSLSLSRIMVVGELRQSSFGAQAEAIMREFAQKWDVLRLPDFEYYCTMSAFLYPTASLERLATLGKMSCLFFYIDDSAVSNSLNKTDKVSTDSIAATSKQEELASLGFIFRMGQLPPAPTKLQHALYELRQELFALSGENTGYFSRFLDSAEQYLIKHSYPSAFVKKAADGAVDLQSYMLWRDDDCGMYPHIDLIEFADDFTLPEAVIAHPILRHLRQTCNRVTSLMNDIISYHKDVVVEGNRFNLVNLIQENTGIGLKEAVEEAINILNTHIVDFLEYEKQLPYWDTVTQLAVKKYIEGLKNQINCAWYWQIRTPRYRSPESPFRELRDISNTAS